MPQKTKSTCIIEQKDYERNLLSHERFHDSIASHNNDFAGCSH